MASLTNSPTYPVPKFQTTVTFALTQVGTDFIRVWCTVAPTGSDLDNQINSQADPRSRVVVFEGSVATAWNYTFDKGGKYTFVAQEYIKGSGYGGGYQGDPNTADNEEKVGAESTLAIYVGQRVTQPIGPPGNQATLVFWVWDYHIRATTKAFHGEDTPAVIATAPGPVLKTAVESSTLVAPLAALVNQPLNDTSVVGNLSTWPAVFFDHYNDHVASIVMHSNADQYNGLLNSFATIKDQKAYQDFVNQLLKLLKQHVTNDLGVAPAVLVGPAAYGPDSGDFHYVSGSYVSDRLAIPLYTSVSSFAEAYGAFADLWRCFGLHEHNTDVHAVETAAPLEDALPLSLIHKVHAAFLAVLADRSPATPPGQSTGVQILISTAGFTET